MISNEDEAFILSFFADGSSFTSIEIDGSKWDGLSVVPFQNDSIINLDILSIESSRANFRKIVRVNWKLFHDRDIRLWSGSGIDIHAFPSMPVLNVARHESVGCVPYLNQTRRRRVLEVIQEIYSDQAFEILYAAEYEMEAVFLDKVSFEQALHFQDLIMEVAPEAFNSATYQLYGTNEVYDDYAVAKAITNNQNFWLQWA
jgi:hypothetical protein